MQHEASRLNSTNIADPLVSKVIAGTYKIESLVGAGGMGTLYKATHQELHKPVALKLVRQTENDRAVSAQQRLLREAQVLAALNHPNIVRIDVVDIDADGRLFVAMEYLEGIDLAMWRQRFGCMSIDQVKAIMRPVCAALSCAHEKQFVHRDLKPSNIMLVGADLANPETCTVKVLDFGLARVLDATTSQKVTATGALIGSPNYMSPEQCQGDQFDRRSDIYSLACVVHELLTGETPFAGEHALSILYRHMTETLPPINVPSLQTTSRFLQWCTAIDPDDRPDGAEEFLNGLEGKTKVGSLRMRKLQMSPLAIAAFGAAILSIAAAGFFCYDEHRKQSAADEKLSTLALRTKADLIVEAEQKAQRGDLEAFGGLVKMLAPYHLTFDDQNHMAKGWGRLMSTGTPANRRMCAQRMADTYVLAYAQMQKEAPQKSAMPCLLELSDCVSNSSRECKLIVYNALEEAKLKVSTENKNDVLMIEALLASLNYSLGRYDRAENECSRLLPKFYRLMEVEPWAPNADLCMYSHVCAETLWLLHQQKNDQEKSIEVSLTWLQKVDPQHEQLVLMPTLVMWCNLAEAYERSSRYEQAAAALMKAAELADHERDASVQLAPGDLRQEKYYVDLAKEKRARAASLLERSRKAGGTASQK